MLKNAIDAKKFVFDKDKRKSIRKEFDLKEEFVIGFIGRVTEPKNPSFIIEVFSEFVKSIIIQIIICWRWKSSIRSKGKGK